MQSLGASTGLLPPVGEDGVPFIAAPPILPRGTVHVQYNFVPKINPGTYFAHSHFAFQHPRGLVFPVIVYDENFRTFTWTVASIFFSIRTRFSRFFFFLVVLPISCV